MWCYFKKVTRWFLTSSIKNVILLNEVIWTSYNFFNLYKKSPCFSMSSFGYNCHFGKILQVMKKALFNKILIGFKNWIRHTVVNGTIYTRQNTLFQRLLTNQEALLAFEKIWFESLLKVNILFSLKWIYPSLPGPWWKQCQKKI